MVLGTEHAATLRLQTALTIYAAKLDDAKRDAVAMRRHDEARRLDEMIRSAQTDWQDAQAIIEAFDRQETERVQTRMRNATLRNFEQLMLRPAGAL